MGRMITILKIEPGKEPYVKEIEDSYEARRKEVEGCIEHVHFRDGCVAILNGEGKCIGMEPNRRYGNDIFCGPFFITTFDDEGEYVSLTDEQIEEYSLRFGEVEQFFGNEPELEPRMSFIAL